AELKDDVRRTGRSLLLSAAGLPPMLVGYVLLMVAIALLLELLLPGWVAFGIVAAVNLIVGAALTVAFGAKVRAEKLALARTSEELRRDRQWISSMRSGDGRGEAAPGSPDAGVRGAGAMQPITGGNRRPKSQQLPAGTSGATPDLEPRSVSASPGQPVAGAT